MTYTDLEKAVLRSDFGDADKPTRLYDLLPAADTLDEPAFVDAVNANLKNGRIVVLVAGDGIRSDAEDLVNGLQSHAGFHFTFALVELAVFQGTSADDLMVVPRTLAKTCMIERGIVRIDDQRSVVVSAPVETTVKGTPPARSISSEQFFEAISNYGQDLPAAIQDFIVKCDAIGVYPEFQKSLNFKWDAPTGKTVNLGYITRRGQVWTDFIGIFARNYVEELAQLFGGEVSQTSGGSLHVMVDGHGPRIERVWNKLDAWVEIIERLQCRIIQDQHNEAEMIKGTDT